MTEQMYPLEKLSDDEWLTLQRFESADRPAEITELDIAAVHRVRTEHGSHIEPPLGEDWSDLEKLRWHAAVVRHDAQLPEAAITVEPGRMTIGGVPQEAYQLTCNRSVTTTDRHTTWDLLSGISWGIELARATAAADQ